MRRCTSCSSDRLRRKRAVQACNISVYWTGGAAGNLTKLSNTQTAVWLFRESERKAICYKLYAISESEKARAKTLYAKARAKTLYAKARAKTLYAKARAKTLYAKARAKTLYAKARAKSKSKSKSKCKRLKRKQQNKPKEANKRRGRCPEAAKQYSVI